MNEYLEVLQHQKAAKIVSSDAAGETLNNPLEGIARVQLQMANIPVTEDSIASILNGLGEGTDIEKLLIAEATSLQNLSSHFWIKSLTSFSSPEVLRSMPEIPSELAAIALKCASESRKCLQLLNEVRNPKKAVFVKNQQNNLLLDQPAQLHLEEPSLYGMDGGEATEIQRIDYDYQTVGEVNRATDAGRQTKKRVKQSQARTTKRTNARNSKTPG